MAENIDLSRIKEPFFIFHCQPSIDSRKVIAKGQSHVANFNLFCWTPMERKVVLIVIIILDWAQDLENFFNQFLLTPVSLNVGMIKGWI